MLRLGGLVYKKGSSGEKMEANVAELCHGNVEDCQLKMGRQ